MKTLTTAVDYAKTAGAVLALAAAIFLGYSAVGYIADTFNVADATTYTCGGCSNSGGGIILLETIHYGLNMQADGGGGGGGGFEPYCTLSVTEGYVHSTSYPPQKQLIFTWTAPYASSFTINNSVGPVTPATGGTYNFYTAYPASVYIGTAVTPYGTVNCQTAYTPPPNPPYCSLVASPTTIQSGDSSTITWNTTSGVSFTVNNGVGSLTPVGGGSFVVSPATTTTYIGTVTGSNYQTAQCQTTITVIPPAECKLEITKVANVASTTPGGQIEYTINVKNAGNAKCTGSGVKIQDVLDPMFIYVSETHSANVTAGYGADPAYKPVTRTVSWNAWDLDPGETGWVKVVGTAGTPTEGCTEAIHNKAQITSYEYNNFTTWVYSSDVVVNVTKDCTPPPPHKCTLEITKVANVATTTPGGQVEYTINFKNTGDAKCTGSGVKVQDTLDTRLTYVSETHSANVTAGYGADPVYKSSDRTVRFNAWDLDPNETGWVKIKVTAGTPTACTEVVPNKAKITSYEYNNFTTWVESQAANVTIDKNCQPPATCSHGYWKNHLFWYDASDPHDVLLLSQLNAQGPGSEALRESARQYLNAEYPHVTCDDVPPPEVCTLEITKSVNDDSVAPNDTVEYTINVKNTGTKKCTGSGVKVQDYLDPRLTYQSETHSSNITAGYGADPVYKSSTRTLYWNAWDLDPNETGWIKFVAKVGTPTSCTESIPNKAKITSLEYDNFTTWVYSNIVSVSVTKDCYQPVPYCTMSIDPTAIDSGQSATLSWNTTNVTTATIDQGVGTVALSGTKSVSPTANTTYTGTFTGPGGTVTCTASITVRTNTPVPQCTISVSASNINSGQSVMVSWTSQNVTQGFVTSVGTTTPVAGGSQEVFPADSTTFTGTFTGPYGSVSCSAPVTVQKGGGGCSGNCGGGLNQPNVVMLQKPPEAPLAFVTLDQIPYTGFEAGKALTLAFWLAIGLLAAAITYFAMGPGAVTYVMGSALSAAGIGTYEGEVEVEEIRPRPVPQTLVPEKNHYAQSVAAAPVYHMPPTAPVTAATQSAADVSDVMESRAHAAGVLMSPEALHMAVSLSKDRGDALRQFGEVLNEAVRTLPREEGWVMLTSERFEEIAQTVRMPQVVATVAQTPSVEAILNSVMPPVAPVVQTNVEMPMSNADDQSIVMSLARAILSGDRDHAYATLRNLEAGHANVATVMTVVAGACDQLYRARRHGLTTELTVPAMQVPDEKLAQIVEIFTHGMDNAYTNPFTSLKLAVAQAFEVRG